MPKRDPKSKSHPGSITAADMAEAARHLHRRLAWAVRTMDQAKAGGATDAEAWEGLTFFDAAPTRTSIDSTAVVVQAVRLTAERKGLDGRRKRLGFDLMLIALSAARGQLAADEAVRQAAAARKDGAPGGAADLRQAREALRARSQPSRFTKMFRVLAWDADAAPRPDSNTALRKCGELRKFYDAFTRDRKSNP